MIILPARVREQADEYFPRLIFMWRTGCTKVTGREAGLYTWKMLKQASEFNGSPDQLRYRCLKALREL